MKSSFPENLAVSKKVPYQKPCLKDYGRLSEITRGSNASSVPDGGTLPHENVKPNNQQPG